MRLFADHCFFACGVDFLRKSGYDIIKASEAGLQKASDEEIIPFCGKENRIILTLDTDFASLYKFPLGSHKGIVVFRLDPFTPEALLNILKIMTERKMFTLFPDSLVIVKGNKIRIVRSGTATETL